MRAIAALLLMSLSTPALAQRPVVVELFTSQGCSSCPPADALLSELAGRADVLPLAFHVTYWNNLGWRDPFSLALATDRQRAYQRQLGAESIYTPQMIVEGHVDVVGSDRAGVRAALASARTQDAVPVAVTSEGGQVQITIGAGPGAASVLLVGFDPVHRTAVARGENGGRQLVESNIVRSFAPVASWQGQGLTVSAPLPAGERAAVILQGRDGRILGAAVLGKMGAAAAASG